MAEDVFDSSSGSEFEDDNASPGGQTGSKESKNDSRTFAEYQGENNRKIGDLQKQIATVTEAVLKLTEAVSKKQTTPTQAPPATRQFTQPQYGVPNPDISEYTDEQLQQALASGRLDPTLQRAVEGVLAERKIERKTVELFEKRDQAQRVSAAEAEAERIALASFPALRDPNSDFSRRVEAAIEQRQARFGKHPQDKLDVARDVAAAMGVQASRVVTPGYVGRTEGGEQPPVDEGAQGMPDDEIAQIAHNLRYAMPLRRNPETGKMERKKFNLKRIKERSKRYEENSLLYHAGRKIGGRSR